MNEFNGSYAGIVENVADPERLGRIKARVPHVHGVNGGVSGFIPTDALAWALPYGMPAGVSSESGGLSWLPQVGDQVLVQFLDGEPEQPVWTWFMQTRAAAKSLKLHHYGTAAKGEVGAPDRAILSRYGHSLELTPDKVTLTTKEGYQVLLEASTSPSGGAIKVQTPKGQWLHMNDAADTMHIQGLESATLSAKRVSLNAPTSATVKTSRLTLMAGSSTVTVQDNSIFIGTASGASVIVDDEGNVSLNSAGGAALSLENNKVQLGTGAGLVIESDKVSMVAPQFVADTFAFSIGVESGWPVLLLTPSALAWFLGHTHPTTSPGAPTGPPIPMGAFPTDSKSTKLQTS